MLFSLLTNYLFDHVESSLLGFCLFTAQHKNNNPQPKTAVVKDILSVLLDHKKNYFNRIPYLLDLV